MSKQFGVVGAVLVGLALCAGTASARKAPADGKPPADLGALAWLAGDWQGTTPEGDFNQEVWVAPNGDSMMGMWRSISASGGVSLFEFLTLMAEKDGIVLRLRHIDRAGVSREKVDKPIRLPLVRGAERELVFSGEANKATLTITYVSPTPGELVVTVEKPGAKEEFRFKRTTAKR